jgi:tRNA uridine 5-carboxymethylaminomethyl modification enzyme
MWPQIKAIDEDILDQIAIEAGYEQYLLRQEADIDAFKRDEALILPIDINYEEVGGLSSEARSKLLEGMPRTLGAASRISGVTPAAITALLRYVKGKNSPHTQNFQATIR